MKKNGLTMRVLAGVMVGLMFFSVLAGLLIYFV